MKKILSMILAIFIAVPMTTFANDETIITEPIVLQDGDTLENVTLYNKTNGYAIRVEGMELSSTEIIGDVTPGGGLDNQYPSITVDDGSMFSVGDRVKIVEGYKIEFNYVYQVDGNKITLLENIIEPYTNAKLYKIETVKDVTIRNVTIISDPSFGSYGIYVTHTENLRIDNVTIENITRKAIHIEHSYMPTVKNSTLRHNGAPGKGDYGLGSSMSFGTMFADNKLVKSGAIVVKGNSHSIIKNNISDSAGLTGGDGISIIGTSDSLFDGNEIIRPNCYGIWMHHGSHRNTIKNNTFTSGITSGIYVTHDSTHNMISDNTLTKNNGNGIFIDFTANENIVKDNIVMNNNSRGILIHGTENIIEGNVSTSNILENIKSLEGNTLNNNTIQ